MATAKKQKVKTYNGYFHPQGEKLSDRINNELTGGSEIADDIEEITSQYDYFEDISFKDWESIIYLLKVYDTPSKVKNLSRDVIKKLRVSVTTALETALKEYGLKVSLGTISFDSSSARVTLKMTTSGLAKKVNESMGSTYGIKVGAKLVFRGSTYVVDSFDESRRKNKVKIKNLKTGKIFLGSPEQIKKYLV